MKKVTFTFGRFQGPTYGHKKLVDKVVSHAKEIGAEPRVYASKSEDNSKNPIPYKNKVKHLRKLFPYANIKDDPEAHTAFHIAKKLSDEGVEHVTMVVGQDRVGEFKKSIGKYVKPRTAPDFDPSKHYAFKHFDVVSAGDRDPDAGGVEGASGTKMREFVRKNDFESFAKNTPTSNANVARAIFNDMKKHLKEDYIPLGLTFSRDLMPQIISPENFVKYLNSKGITSTKKIIDPNYLRSSQMDFDHQKIAKLRDEKNTKPIIVSGHDGSVIDGHHRWMAKKLNGEKVVSYVCDAPSLDLITAGKTFNSVLEEEVTRKQLAPMLDSFVSFASEKLGLKSLPNIKYKSDDDDYNSFAAYNPSSNELSISTMNRHPMDIFRSVAHELVHHKQNEDGRIGKNIKKEGSTGSDIENEANSEAGKIMRWFAKANPDMFKQGYVVEEIANSASGGGIRGLGNVTGNPAFDDEEESNYMTQNLSDTETLKDRVDQLINKTTTDTFYTWKDNNWWMNSDDKKAYHAKTIKGIRAKAQNLNEGINDPGRLKAVFLAGGPGSGKDFVMNKALAGNGLREINSDNALEYLMSKHGLDMEMPDEERIQREILRGQAKNTTLKKEVSSLAGRLGLIVNGTADDLEKIRTVKSELEDLGYDTMMVFVNTSNEVSRQRNVERGKAGGRKVPDGTDKQGTPDNSPNIRQEKWDLAQKNLSELEKIFGKDKFAVIDNTADLRKVTPDEKNRIEGEFSRVRRMTMQFVQAPVQNKRGKAWTERRARYQGTTQYTPPKTYTKPQAPARVEMPKAIVKPSSEVMNQARRLGLSYYGFGRFGRKIGGENKVLYHSKGNQLVRVQNMNEDKDDTSTENLSIENSYFMDKVKNFMKDNITEEKKTAPKGVCWKNYKMVGMKTKNGRKVPNCVPVEEGEEKVAMSKKGKIKRKLVAIDEAFEDYIKDTHNREIGTDSLTNIYKSMTPGQTPEKPKMVKKKIVAKEDNSFPRGKFALPKSGGLGPEYGIQVSPALVTGFANIGNAVFEASKSIQEWAMNPKTQQKFFEKYGEHAEKKLIEAALTLEKSGCGTDKVDAKSIKKIKETFAAASYGKSPTDTLSPIGNQNKDDIRPIAASVAEDWQKINRQDKTDGLSQKAVNAYRRENPGSKLQTAVTEKNPKGKRAKRRLSFCRRMKGMKNKLTSAKTSRDPNSRINKALRRWNCEE